MASAWRKAHVNSVYIKRNYAKYSTLFPAQVLPPSDRSRTSEYLSEKCFKSLKFEIGGKTQAVLSPISNSSDLKHFSLKYSLVRERSEGGIRTGKRVCEKLIFQWAFALTVWEMMTEAKESPFQNFESGDELRTYLGKGHDVIEWPAVCPREIRDIVDQCLDLNVSVSKQQDDNACLLFSLNCDRHSMICATNGRH